MTEELTKITENSETLYFNKMWTLHTDSGNATTGGQTAKNIYLGDTRIVTKLNSGSGATYSEENAKQYFYHSDHLGNASLISDKDGNEYQRIEYTPYGETWVEKTQNNGLEWLPYKFTAKEMDEETGLYYYGARYLDPKYSRWLSTDPALGEYVPSAGKGTEKDAGNLPGMGGLFNTVNGNLYHYAGNNPVKYTDPDGREILNAARTLMNSAGDASLGNSKKKIKDVGCVLTAYTRMASAILGKEISLSDANKIGVENNLFSGEKGAENLLSPETGAALVNAILAENGVTDITISFDGSYTGEEAVNKYSAANSSTGEQYLATVRVNTHDSKGKYYNHTMNVDSDAYAENACGWANLKVNDTSGVRSQLVDDPSGRKSKFLRMDFFKINKVPNEAQE